MTKETKFILQGIVMVPLLCVLGTLFICFEILLGLLIMGWSLPLLLLGLIPCLSIQGNLEVWNAKCKWIRWTGIPYIKAHRFFCKIQGLTQDPL